MQMPVRTPDKLKDNPEKCGKEQISECHDNQETPCSSPAKAAIKRIAAAFTGMMVVVVIGLARYSLVDTPSVAVALATFRTLRLGKLDTVWVILGGTAAYWLLTKLIALLL